MEMSKHNLYLQSGQEVLSVKLSENTCVALLKASDCPFSTAHIL